MNKEVKVAIIFGVYASFISIMGIFMSTEQISTMLGIWAIVIGTILMFASLYFWVIAYSQKDKSVWDNIDKAGKSKKYKVSVDVHKSSDWKNDGEIFLCVHNEHFFKKIFDLSVAISHIFKVSKNGSYEAEIDRSVILKDVFHLDRQRDFVDLPFIEILKNEDKFVIYAKHQEDESGNIFSYKFPKGQYIVNLVVRKLVVPDGQKSFPSVPVRIKYDGFDRIECEVDFSAIIDYRHERLPRSNVLVLQT